MKMGLIHDLAESIVGDITPVDDVSADDKHQMELVSCVLIYLCFQGAFSTIVADFPQPLKDEFINLWMEYEEQKTLASNYVFDFDKLDMLVQAEDYEAGNLLKGVAFCRTRNQSAGVLRLNGGSL